MLMLMINLLARDNFHVVKNASFYHCNDGKEHKISEKTYIVRSENPDAVIEA